MSDNAKIDRLLQLLTHSTGSSYDETTARLRQARDVFHECIAQQLQDPLNAKLRTMPHSSYQEKRELAVFANHELREFSLAVKCPNTSIPTTFQVDIGNRPHGRLRLRSAADANRHTFTSVDLFQVKLMPRFGGTVDIKKWIGAAAPGEDDGSRRR